jgi:hypothetical protein
MSYSFPQYFEPSIKEDYSLEKLLEEVEDTIEKITEQTWSM